MYPIKLSGVLVLFVILIGVRSQSGEDSEISHEKPTPGYKHSSTPHINKVRDIIDDRFVDCLYAHLRRFDTFESHYFWIIIHSCYRRRHPELPDSYLDDELVDLEDRFDDCVSGYSEYYPRHHRFGSRFRRYTPAFDIADILVRCLLRDVKPIDDTPPGVPENEKKCPPGFHYVQKARSCYKIVYEGHNWTSADRRCHELHPEAHLVAITKSAENRALTTYLSDELVKYGRKDQHVCRPLSLSWGDEQFWTSGRRPNEKSCVEPFVWKISNDTQLPMSFTNWYSYEPNCSGNNEHCLHLPSGGGFVWNDINCSEKICPLCEYDPLE